MQRATTRKFLVTTSVLLVAVLILNACGSSKKRRYSSSGSNTLRMKAEPVSAFSTGEGPFIAVRSGTVTGEIVSDRFARLLNGSEKRALLRATTRAVTSRTVNWSHSWSGHGPREDTNSSSQPRSGKDTATGWVTATSGVYRSNNTRCRNVVQVVRKNGKKYSDNLKVCSGTPRHNKPWKVPN